MKAADGMTSADYYFDSYAHFGAIFVSYNTIKFSSFANIHILYTMPGIHEVRSKWLVVW